MQLWTDAGFTRYYLIPSQCELHPGSYEIFDVLGSLRRVEEAQLERFFVTPEEAQAWAERVERATDAELEAMSVAAASSAEVRPTGELLREDVRALLEGLGDLFDEAQAAQLCDALGLDYERLAEDPAALANLWSELMATAALALEPSHRREVFPALAKVLKRHGYPEAARKIRRAPESLRPFVERLVSRIALAMSRSTPADLEAASRSEA